MTIDQGDLEAAVAEGIVTPEQIERLRAFADSRKRTVERADEERFHFMRGFNDFFFAVGIVLFGIGIAFFADASTIENAIAAALIWALAELLVGRMRLVLPGILLTCLFTFFAFRLTDFDWPSITQALKLPAQPPALPRTFLGALGGIAVAVKGLAAAVAAGIFYARFRLPFTLLVIAGSVVLCVAAVFGAVLFPAPTTLPLVLLACGIGVFAAAMTYDLADRKRLTRKADCAFWLHLLAAPLVVHSLIQLLVPPLSVGGRGPGMSMAYAATIFVIVACLTALAILIDRRALLVSALAYLGIAIGYAITGSLRAGTGSEPAVFFATLAILGAMVLALGIGWQLLRRLFLRLFPARLVARLPPAAYPA